MAPSGSAARRPSTTSRRAVWTTVAFALAVLVPSLYGFGTKFREFVMLFRGDVDGVFAISPITNYLLASMGFFCFFCWATMQGMFRDIELPKHNMLETEAELNATGPNPPTPMFAERLPRRIAARGRWQPPLSPRDL